MSTLSLRADMRWWLNRIMPDIASIIDAMRTDQLAAMIETHYEGGMARFSDVYGHADATVADDDLDPQLALRRSLRVSLGRPFAIAACHEMIRVDVTATRVYVVMRVITEVERGTDFVRRLEQRRATVRLLSFDRTTSRLLPSERIEWRDQEFNADEYVNSHLKSTRNAMPANFYETWEYQS